MQGGRETYIRLDVLVLEVESVFPDIDTDDGNVSYIDQNLDTLRAT